MKKILPIVMFVLLVFAGCQRGPATYQKASSPREVAANAEKFVKQVGKQSKHYSSEDWEFAVHEFVVMCKDFHSNRVNLTEEEIMRFDGARLEMMKAIDANGSAEIAAEVKEIYSEFEH